MTGQAVVVAAALSAWIGSGHSQADSTGFVSIDTGRTVCKVRSAEARGTPYIVASSYNGAVLGVSYHGTILWEHHLSGFMNHDLWCEDITGDGADEVLAANADGSIYCLAGTGKLLWRFKASDAPCTP